MLQARSVDEALNDLVWEWVRSREVEAYFAPALNVARARVVATQFGLFVRNRRSCWALMAGNAPLEVKRDVVLHEYEELVYDPLAKGDHYHLWVLQASHLGLSQEQMDNADPLPTTLACLLAWERIASYRPWLEAFAASTILERTNDSRLLKGMGHASRAREKWMKDLGFGEEMLPNWQVHKKADDEHSSMGQRVIERYAVDEQARAQVAHGARDSLCIYRAFFQGIADAIQAQPER
jgi:pyrroloquinoline quinone (PQQ) biosynthesis protein C